MNSVFSPPTIIPSAEEPGRGVRGFTRDPSQLQGTMLQTALRKSPQGFGFTIIGGDRPDEFLQVKNVLLDGPAAHDNKIASGTHPPGRAGCRSPRWKDELKKKLVLQLLIRRSAVWTVDALCSFFR